MVGYNTILKIERLREQASQFGFSFCYSSGRNYSYDTVGLKPKDADSLPVYSRDACCFVGTIDELELFLRGIHWARNYDSMIKLSTDKQRAQKEQNVRNTQLCKILKDENIEKDLIK